MKAFLKVLLKMFPMSPQIFLNLARRFAHASGKRFFIFENNLAGEGGAVRMAVRSFWGFWYCGNFGDSADIAFGVFHSGMVEQKESFLIEYLLKRLLNKKDRIVFYDVGANTGYFSILASYFGKERVLSCGFEAVRDSFEVAQQSVILNRLEDHCRFFNVGLGDKNEKLRILKKGTGSTFVKSFIGNQEAEGEDVNVYALDYFRESNNLPGPDIMLVDVEGFEYQVFRGAEQTIRACLPVMVFESVAIFKERHFVNENFDLVQKFMANLNYEVFVLKEKNLEVYKQRVDVVNGVNMFLALHKIKHRDEIAALTKDYPEIISGRMRQ